MAYGDERIGGRGLEFGPAPAGFDMAPYDIGERDPASLSERGCCYHLSATRLDLSGPERTFTSRLVQQVMGGDGLQPAASFEASFNPAYERLVIHAIRVWRDGQARDAAVPEAFELFRRELNLERAVYDGRLTAHMIVPDVRVGDVVDTAFSIIGQHPVLGDSLAFSPRLQWSSPVVETWVEVKVPADRALTIRAFGRTPKPSDVTKGGVRTLLWRTLDAPPHRHETDAPTWHVGFGSLLVADEIDWPRVAEMFRGFYAAPDRLPASLDAEIRAIGSAHPTPQERAAAGLRFVQGALRYHSIGVGDGGFRPRPVETIWETRYGDCKDASRLLTVVLNRLGVEAVPALVNTRVGPDLANEAPNATAFDHCIVRATVDGAHWWLDPTLTPQAGDLQHLTRPRHDWALPLVEGGTLEPMRGAGVPTVCETRETWTFDKLADRPARLEIRTLYRDWRADDIRRWLANDAVTGVSRRLRDSLEGEYGLAVEAAPLQIRDDRTANLLELVELYDVDRPFQTTGTGALSFVSRDDVVAPNLKHLDPVRRQEPIDLGWPRRVVTERIFNLPVRLDLQAWDTEHAGPAGRLRNRFEWQGKRQALHVVDLTLSQRIVPADQASAHYEFLNKARDHNGVNFAVRTRNGRLVAGKDPGRGGPVWALVIWIAIVGLMILARIATAAG